MQDYSDEERWDHPVGIILLVLIEAPYSAELDFDLLLERTTRLTDPESHAVMILNGCMQQKHTQQASRHVPSAWRLSP